ncbi:MAG: DUF484 family protein [Gammaproteobacteria bacterium]|nr:MAG: DUF484 family protein [Gammaproteobacteria bacterium]
MSDATRSLEEIVAKFLRHNPDFLQREPVLLKDLELSHASGPAVSLIEKQVQYLRGQNETLEHRLNQLVQVASDNEKLMSRLHQLTLELMSMRDLPSFFDRLSEALLSEFNADIINITLFDLKVEAGVKTPMFHTRRDDPELQQFQDHLEKGESICGRLNRNKRDYLFASRAQWVQSTALVPLSKDGLLAIGSSDPARFYPGMGTLFLDLLARVVVSRLALEVPEVQRKSA